MSGRKRPREKRGKRRTFSTVLFWGVCAALAIYALYFLFLSFSLPRPPRPTTSSNGDAGQVRPRRAAIVDQLGLLTSKVSYPNETFIRESTSILEGAGYSVDYYGADKVKIDFYRYLPSYGYDLIVLRVHAALEYVGGDPEKPANCCDLFTSEPYQTWPPKYIAEQSDGRVVRVMFLTSTETYFGISPKFVRDRNSMWGRFNGTVVVMMGCDGLTYTGMAEAFVARGARACVGWSGPVSADHTDEATLRLLRHLVAEGETLGSAVRMVREEVGPDPTYNGTMRYYPDGAGGYRLPAP